MEPYLPLIVPRPGSKPFGPSLARDNTLQPSTHSLATPGGRHASAGGRQAGKSPHYRPILRQYAQRVLSPRKPPAPPAVPGTRPHPQTTPMPCPARARTSTHTTRRAQHAPIPANRLNAVPSTRPHSNACPARARTSTHTARRAQHAPASAHHALLRYSARQYARGSFLETLDLKSAWYDATASPLPRPSVRQGVLSRDPGPQVYLVRRHRN